MALGVTFAPGSQDPQSQTPGALPVQEAIRLLSLRLPRVVGANSPIPAPLLNSPGGMGQPDPMGNPLLDLLRRLLAGGGGMGDLGGAMGMPTVPFGAPRVTPGGVQPPGGGGGGGSLPPFTMEPLPAPPSPQPLPPMGGPAPAPPAPGPWESPYPFPEM